MRIIKGVDVNDPALKGEACNSLPQLLRGYIRLVDRQPLRF